MQDKQTTNSDDFSKIISLPAAGRIIALDLGTKKIGVAVCDELQITTRPLPLIKRKSWKELLKHIKSLIDQFDAIGLVLGLPVNFDETENEMSVESRRIHRNFSRSLSIPVFLQDERLTSKSAQQYLYDLGYEMKEIFRQIDSEAAVIILEDFLAIKNGIRRRN